MYISSIWTEAIDNDETIFDDNISQQVNDAVGGSSLGILIDKWFNESYVDLSLACLDCTTRKSGQTMSESQEFLTGDANASYATTDADPDDTESYMQVRWQKCH